jgi:hypothetical protein
MGNLLSRRPAAFVIMGHGEEAVTQPFDERFQLPPGYSLVTLAECGLVTQFENVTPMLAAMQQGQYLRLFQDPRLGKQAIERITGQQLHVYTEGMRIPRFTMSLFTTWKDSPKNQRQLMMSGIFPLPLKRRDIGIEDLQTFSEWKLGETFFARRDDVESAFAGSIFPSSAFVQTVLSEAQTTARSSEKPAAGMSGFNAMTAQTRFTFSFEQLIQDGTLPPGTYYYVICRSPEKSFDLMQQAVELSTFVDQSTIVQWLLDLCGEEPPASIFKDPDDLTKDDLDEQEAYRRRCERSSADKLAAYRERVRSSGPTDPNYWSYENFQKMLRGIDAMRVIPAVRRASLEQQRLQARGLRS